MFCEPKNSWDTSYSAVWDAPMAFKDCGSLFSRKSHVCIPIYQIVSVAYCFFLITAAYVDGRIEAFLHSMEVISALSSLAYICNILFVLFYYFFSKPWRTWLSKNLIGTRRRWLCDDRKSRSNWATEQCAIGQKLRLDNTFLTVTMWKLRNWCSSLIRNCWTSFLHSSFITLLSDAKWPSISWRQMWRKRKPNRWCTPTVSPYQRHHQPRRRNW